MLLIFGYFIGFEFLKIVKLDATDWLQSKSMDWFLYDRDLRHARVQKIFEQLPLHKKKQDSNYNMD